MQCQINLYDKLLKQECSWGWEVELVIKFAQQQLCSVWCRNSELCFSQGLCIADVACAMQAMDLALVEIRTPQALAA